MERRKIRISWARNAKSCRGVPRTPIFTVIAPIFVILTPVCFLMTPMRLFLTPVDFFMTPKRMKLTPVKFLHFFCDATPLSISTPVTPEHLFLTPVSSKFSIFDATLTLFLSPSNTPLPASVPGSACGVKYFSHRRKSLTPHTLPGRSQPSGSIWGCRL